MPASRVVCALSSAEHGGVSLLRGPRAMSRSFNRSATSVPSLLGSSTAIENDNRLTERRRVADRRRPSLTHLFLAILTSNRGDAMSSHLALLWIAPRYLGLCSGARSVQQLSRSLDGYAGHSGPSEMSGAGMGSLFLRRASLPRAVAQGVARVASRRAQCLR